MTPEYAAAFHKMQSELPTVPKSRKGQEGKQNYKYADLASIMEAAAPVMQKHGFALMHKPIVNTDDKGTTHAGVEAILIHESGAFESCSFTMPVTKEYGTLAKTVGGIITYARRYSMSILGICTEDDSDNAQGVGSRPMVDPAVSRPNRQPEPRAPKPASPMSNASKTKLAYAARERIKELGDDSIGPVEIIRSVAKAMGYASEIELTDDDFGSALSKVQTFDPGE
jgi:hypothetical protein